MEQPKPYIDERGNLRIPLDCDPKYKHWAGGQSVIKTLKEINAPDELIRQYARQEDNPKELASAA